MQWNAVGSNLALGCDRWAVFKTIVLAFVAFTSCDVSLGPAYAIKATVSGLVGSGLQLEMNGHDPVTVSTNGEVTLAFMVSGYHYSVTVKKQPINPPQTCTVTNRIGTMGSTDVTNVAVSCTTTYAISGTVSGLQGTGLVLNNILGESGPGDDLSISTDGTFIFPTRAAAQAKYTAIVKTQPTPVPPKTSETCSVVNGRGTVEDADVSNIKVICSTDAFKVGGTVSGLQGTKVVLQNNDTDYLDITTDGAFTFNAAVASGAEYTVKVITNPTSPWQTCTVTNGTGTIKSTEVTAVNVTCVTNKYAIVAYVSGLIGRGLKLRNNNGEELAVASNGNVSFATHLNSGSTYNVAVMTQPADPIQYCTVINPSGIIAGMDVTNIKVKCSLPVVAIGTGAGGAMAMVSLDGETWAARPMPLGHYYAVAWSGSFFVAVGDGVAATSPNGMTWTAHAIGSRCYYAVACNGSICTAVGYNLQGRDGVAATSPDGVTWIEHTIPYGTSYMGSHYALIWNGSLFYAVGDGISAVSPDGVTWSVRPPVAQGEMQAFRAIAWNSEVFAAVGDKIAARSLDGMVWDNVSVPDGRYSGIASNGSRFVAGGNNGPLISSDGMNWTPGVTPLGGPFGPVIWNGSVFIGLQGQGVATSSDGISWANSEFPSGGIEYRAVASVVVQ